MSVHGRRWILERRPCSVIGGVEMKQSRATAVIALTIGVFLLVLAGWHPTSQPLGFTSGLAGLWWQSGLVALLSALGDGAIAVSTILWRAGK